MIGATPPETVQDSAAPRPHHPPSICLAPAEIAEDNLPRKCSRVHRG